MRSAYRALRGSLLVLFAFHAAAESELFPRPAELEPAVKFWTRVYTEIDTQQGFIHDSLRMDIVFQTVRIADDLGTRERRRRIERAMETTRNVLTKLAGGARQDLSNDEERILKLFPEGTSNAELRAAAGSTALPARPGGSVSRRVGSLGERGSRTSTKVLAKRGLPLELAALPHVESSFDPDGVLEGRRGRHVAVHALDGRALHAHRPHRRRAPRSVLLDATPRRGCSPTISASFSPGRSR